MANRSHSESGHLHFIAAIATALVLAVVLLAIQRWTDEKKAERQTQQRSAVQKQALNDVMNTTTDLSIQVDAERMRVERAMGMAATKDEMLERASHLSGSARAAAQVRLAGALKQPLDLPLERLLDIAFVRWEAVRDFSSGSHPPATPDESPLP